MVLCVMVRFPSFGFLGEESVGSGPDASANAIQQQKDQGTSTTHEQRHTPRHTTPLSYQQMQSFNTWLLCDDPIACSSLTDVVVM